MSWKSVFLSVLTILLFFADVFFIAFAFSSGILFGILSIFSLIIPAVVQRKALDEADGIVDRFIAKYVVLIFAVIAVIGGLALAGYWIELFH